MARKSKAKRILRKNKTERIIKETEVSVDVPIPNMPEKFLWMRVKSGTKIRNVLNHASKEFSGYKSILWSGAGQGIGKVITCAEIMKRNNPGLHQISKLHYIKSNNKNEKEDDGVIESRTVPEIHILLSKDPLDSNEPGHQSSSDEGLFVSRKSELSSLEDGSNISKENVIDKNKNKHQQLPSTSKLSNIATKEFAAMGLRTGQKRRHRDNQKSETFLFDKKNKVK